MKRIQQSRLFRPHTDRTRFTWKPSVRCHTMSRGAPQPGQAPNVSTASSSHLDQPTACVTELPEWARYVQSDVG
jgi:hypothetical protein